MRLANLDNDAQFRDLLDEANRANASFYPIDPRGLAVFDTPLVRQDVPGPPPPMVPPSVDMAMLRGASTRCERSRKRPMAWRSSTRNDLAGGLRRVVDDLSSYYLLGYYSTGKLDGRFHPITVRIKRPGRESARAPRLPGGDACGSDRCRASGCCALRPKPAVSAEAEASARVIGAAIGPLAGYARELPLRLQAAAGWKPGDAASAALWVVGELGSAAATGDAFNEGFAVTLTLSTPADQTVGSGTATRRQGRAHVPRAGDADPAADRGRLRAARRRTRRRRIDPVAGDRAARRDRRARLIRRDLHPPNRDQGSADRGSAVPAQRAGARRNPDGQLGSADGAAARSQRAAAGRAGHRGGARRCRRVAVAHGAARARAARGGGLRHRIDGGFEETMAAFRVVQ